MKAYKVTILVVDDEVGSADRVKEEMENVRYPNRCISPIVMDIEERDIGEWFDGHPLNHRDTIVQEFVRLFPHRPRP